MDTTSQKNQANQGNQENQESIHNMNTNGTTPKKKSSSTTFSDNNQYEKEEEKQVENVKDITQLMHSAAGVKGAQDGRESATVYMMAYKQTFDTLVERGTLNLWKDELNKMGINPSDYVPKNIENSHDDLAKVIAGCSEAIGLLPTAF